MNSSERIRKVLSGKIPDRIPICEVSFWPKTIEGIKPDAIWLWSDLCYKNGMLFSPEIYKKLVYASHRKIKSFCQKHNLFLIFHCDGYVKEFISLLIEAGVDAIQPLEARISRRFL